MLLRARKEGRKCPSAGPLKARTRSHLAGAPEEVNRDALGGLAVFRDQDAGSSLVPLSADILIVEERKTFLLEAISVSLRVVDELLREENVPWFGEGFDPSGDDNNVGDFGVLRAFQSGIEFPEPAMRANSDLQIVSRGQELGAEPSRRPQQPARASISQNQMVAGGRIGVVQIARELPEQIAPVFVEGLRPPGNLNDVFPVAANITNRDKADAFFRPPFELIADDIVLVQLFEKPDVSPRDEVAERGVDEIGLGVRQDMDLAEGDVPDRSELLHEPGGIVAALLDDSDQPQCIEGAEKMARRLGFDLVLSRRDVRIGLGRLDNLIICQHVGFDDLGEDLRIQSAEEGRDLVEQRFYPLRGCGIDRVANFLLTSSLDADQADLLADDDRVARSQRAVASPIVYRSLLPCCSGI